MPSRGRQQYSTVEVKPESVTSKSNIAPSSPGSPKKVAFAPCIKAEARALSGAEAWSLYHFEAHARQCPDCYNPLDVHLEGRSLCATGHGLAQDVAEHVYRKDGVVYSKKKDNHKLVQVDLPREYTQVPQLLRSMERALRTTHRTVPIISYDPSYPVSARRTTKLDNDYEDRTEVIIEPARTDSKRQSKSKHKTTRYKTVVVDEDIEASAARQPDPARKEKRGSLYYEDLQRQRKEAYRVEVREPERRERRRERDRPRSEYYV
jgi:hypothetical protein